MNRSKNIDFLFQFDIGVMSQIRAKLSDSATRCSTWKSVGRLEPDPNGYLSEQVLVLSGKVIAKRTDQDGQVRVLQRWLPENM